MVIVPLSVPPTPEATVMSLAPADEFLTVNSIAFPTPAWLNAGSINVAVGNVYADPAIGVPSINPPNTSAAVRVTTPILAVTVI